MIFLDVLLECGPKLDRCFLRTSIVWKNEPLSTRGALVVDRVTALPRFDDQVNVVVHFCNLTGWNRAKSYWRRRLVSERSLPFGLCEIKVHLFCFFQWSGECRWNWDSFAEEHPRSVSLLALQAFAGPIRTGGAQSSAKIYPKN